MRIRLLNVLGKEPWRLEEFRAQEEVSKAQSTRSASPTLLGHLLPSVDTRSFPASESIRGCSPSEDGNCELGRVKEALSSQALAIFPQGQLT